MARYYLRTAQADADDDEAGTSIDDLIRPGLNQAFPLPTTGKPDDDRFGVLLEALAQPREKTG